MKPYLVDVPVRVNIWIRPECQRRQLEVLQKARPSILFIQSDGGRNEREWEAIRTNRKMIDEGIDWECTVYRLYEDHNNGIYGMGKKISELIWKTVDRCIFLEDDILPSVSFFQYCADLLEKYKDDQRIEVICGMNHLGKCEEVQSDYFFARQGSIWGTATWKRTIEERANFDYAKDPYTMKLLRQRTKGNSIIWDRLNAYAKQEKYEGHIAGGEFWIEFNMYAQNRLQIIPRVNLVSNIGCTDDALHAETLDQMPRGKRKWFNMETYELDFPLKHPRYIMPDVEYEKKRNKIMRHNMPFGRFMWSVERGFIKLRSGHPEDISIKRFFRRTFLHKYTEQK